MHNYHIDDQNIAASTHQNIVIPAVAHSATIINIKPATTRRPNALPPLMKATIAFEKVLALTASRMVNIAVLLDIVP